MSLDLHPSPQCFACGTELLAAVSFDVKDGLLLRCPSCERYWYCDGARADLYWPPRTVYDGSTYHPKPRSGGVRYQGHVNRDGTTCFDLDKDASARMAPWEVSAIADALGHLQLQARHHLAKISGTDRYVFTCHAGIYSVKHRGITANLLAYKARGPWTCLVCGNETQAGAFIYRDAEPKNAGDIRFCAKCAEAAPDEAKRDTPPVRPVLKVIDGGRGRRR